MGGQCVLRSVELGLQELRVPPGEYLIEVHRSIGCLMQCFQPCTLPGRHHTPG
jgi:hypothetical protein